MSDEQSEFRGPGDWKAQADQAEQPTPEESEFRGPGDWKSQAGKVEQPSSAWDMDDEPPEDDEALT